MMKGRDLIQIQIQGVEELDWFVGFLLCYLPFSLSLSPRYSSTGSVFQRSVLS